MEYYPEFQVFVKYASQRESVAKAVAALDLGPPGSEAFTFVDVGSNDGHLTGEALGSLRERFGEVRTYAFEPDVKSYLKLAARFALDPDTQVDRLDFNGWLEKYREELAGQVDLLLNSHTFYHFPPETWGRLFSQSSGLLSQAGKHLVVMESDKTSIIKLKPRVDERGVKLTTDIYGEYRVSSEIEAFLHSEGLPYEHMLIEEPIRIPANQNAQLNLARLLGFVYRCSGDDLLEKTEDILAGFLS
ncbi:MAG: hypothetical protein ACE5FW_03075, partial [Candidatus Aenigmatarchaeota archaeon]